MFFFATSVQVFCENSNFGIFIRKSGLAAMNNVFDGFILFVPCIVDEVYQRVAIKHFPRTINGSFGPWPWIVDCIDFRFYFVVEVEARIYSNSSARINKTDERSFFGTHGQRDVSHVAVFFTEVERI